MFAVPCCCGVTCLSVCQNNLAPTQFRMDVSGISTSLGGTCCTAAYDKSYYVPTNPGFCTGLTGFAYDPTCFFTPMLSDAAAFKLYTTGGRYYSQFRLSSLLSAFASTSIYWEYDHGTSPPDCTAFNNLLHPYVAVTADGSGSTGVGGYDGVNHRCYGGSPYVGSDSQCLVTSIT